VLIYFGRGQLVSRCSSLTLQVSQSRSNHTDASAYCEFHPVKTIQKITLPSDMQGAHDPTKPLPADKQDRINNYHDRWQRELNKAPPPADPRHPGGLTGAQLGSLTPAQQEVYVNQRRPEHQWQMHPLIDGCAPSRDRNNSSNNGGIR